MGLKRYLSCNSCVPTQSVAHLVLLWDVLIYTHETVIDISLSNVFCNDVVVKFASSRYCYSPQIVLLQGLSIVRVWVICKCVSVCVRACVCVCVCAPRAALLVSPPPPCCTADLTPHPPYCTAGLTRDKSAVCLLESREQRCVKAMTKSPTIREL